MALHWFNPPVYVRTHRPGVRFGVSHVEGAADQLLKWSNKEPRWDYAVRVCMATLARKAFAAAAKEEKSFCQ